MTYRKVPEYDFRSGAGDEGFISDGEFEVLNSDYQKRLLELIILHYETDEIEASYNDEFYDEYKSYLDLYSAVINGESPSYRVEKEIFETLAKEGYINNGLLKVEHYYKTKYNDYYISNASYEHVTENAEPYYTKDEMFQALLDNGTIVEIADNTYKHAR
jgi:hypothetical protein